jgi:uncharacterized protein YegP (UPF0339 family)
MQFRVFEDNGGDYHWTIDGADGQRLVRSAGFASYDDALRAARIVRDGAGSADMETSPPTTAPLPAHTPTGRKPAAVSDELDAGRWLDEGASSRSSAKAK